MVRSNQLIIDHEDDDYICQPCDRRFNSEQGALNHCRNARVHAGEWCERCEWLFVSPQARQTHRDHSSRHNICGRCSIDFPTYTRFVEHNADVHHQCSECDEKFENDNNLQQHKRTHLPQEIECFGCYRTFREYSGMMIHLESGACESGVDRDDINSWMFDSFSTSRFLNGWRDYHRYTCPGCGDDFRFLSALLQHIESNACDEYIGDAMSDIKYEITLRL